LIDYYLLDDTENLNRFSKISKLNSYTMLELVALTDGLRNKNKKFVTSILNYVKMHRIKQKICKNTRKILFDSVL